MIFYSDSGSNSINSIFLQQEKAYSPISTTLFGIVIVLSDEFLKAFLSVNLIYEFVEN